VARPTKCRRICRRPGWARFAPDGESPEGEIVLTLDEYEAIRLIDLEGRTHAECAQQMGISRTTVTEIYESARHKIAEAIVGGMTLTIDGGHVKLCDGTALGCCGRPHCWRADTRLIKKIKRKEDNQMRIAVTYDNGQIFQHFGRTEAFKVYDVEDGRIVNAQVVGTGGQGHGALAGLLAQSDVDVLICGGIGGGAQNALAQMGIQLYGGVSGDADAAVDALLKGELSYNPDVHCGHHGEGHQCGHHHGGGEGHHCGHHHHHADGDGHTCCH
jgi:predicted DNA-binding protein (UPF0251 family)/predicted Fe-Mo cluster-binding NifX family protein